MVSVVGGSRELFCLTVLLFLQMLVCPSLQQCTEPKISSDQAVNYIVNGSEVHSSVILLQCTTSMNIYWYINGIPNEGHNTQFYVVDRPLMAGTYQCGYGDCLSDPITVITPPKIMLQPHYNQTVNISEDFSIQCKVTDGYPQPNISWYFEDIPINISNYNLEIASATLENGGKYTCLAQNEAGYVTSVAYVFVLGPVLVSSSNIQSYSTSHIAMSSSYDFEEILPSLTIESTTDEQTIITTNSNGNGDTKETNTRETPSIELITTLAVVIPALILVITVIMAVLFWCQKLQMGNKEKKGKNKKKKDRLLDDIDGRSTIPTSTSYVNASFREEDEYEYNGSDDEMKIEINFSDSEKSKGVISVHAYKAENVQLYDEVKRPPPKETMTLIDEVDELESTHEYVYDSIPDEISIEHVSVNEHVTHNEDKDERTMETIIGEEPVKVKQESLSESQEETKLLLQPQNTPNVEESIVETSRDAIIQEVESECRIWNPKWLMLMRASYERSHILLPAELVNLAYKLDTMSAKKKEHAHPLQKEFEDSPFNLTSSVEWPQETMSKNRYANIFPTPQTAVTLSDTGEPGSTYINANFIRGYDGYRKTYISAQAPIYDTVPDFWRMIWENNVDCIVMLTGIFEGGKNKCAKYWPPSNENDTQTYGRFTVRNIHEELYENYKITFLNIASMDDPTKDRDVYHFSFIGWPDFGAPNDGNGILQLRNAVESIRQSESTLLVHCSAGLGRSGTYIGIDIGIHQHNEEGVVDPLLILTLMREDRGGMIQSLDQYEFLHSTLASYVVQNLQ